MSEGVLYRWGREAEPADIERLVRALSRMPANNPPIPEHLVSGLTPMIAMVTQVRMGAYESGPHWDDPPPRLSAEIIVKTPHGFRCTSEDLGEEAEAKSHFLNRKGKIFWTLGDQQSFSVYHSALARPEVITAPPPMPDWVYDRQRLPLAPQDSSPAVSEDLAFEASLRSIRLAAFFASDFGRKQPPESVHPAVALSLTPGFDEFAPEFTVLVAAKNGLFRTNVRSRYAPSRVGAMGVLLWSSRFVQLTTSNQVIPLKLPP